MKKRPLNISDTRQILHETMQSIQTGDENMTVEKAQAIANLGRVMIESAKAEVAYIATTQAEETTGFLDALETKEEPIIGNWKLENSDAKVRQIGNGVTVRDHTQRETI